MRIAINTRLLLKGKMDGIGWFTAETARRMVLAHPEHTFYFFFDRKPAPEFIFAPNVVPVVLQPQARLPILWYLFFEWSVPMALRRYKIDIFLSPDGMIPLRTKVPTVSVIHDINFEHSPDNLKPMHQRFFTKFYPQYARCSTRVATVSEYSKHDICDVYHISEDKVDVVYDGANENYRPHTENEKDAIRRRYTGSCCYLIFISTIIKRKNLTNLLLAFDRVKSMEPDDLKLVVVGSRVWWQDELAEAYNSMQHKADVIMPGHVEPADLSALLSGAEALVYPSYFEGFGIPILEAMYAETAVISSNTTSMPEVAGDAAIYINPASVDDIVHAIRAIREQAVRERLIDVGRRQREKYSWERTANLLWSSLMKSIGRV